MVNVTKMTNEEIMEVGLAILEKELGPVGMARFIQQFDLGHGDYTKDRKNWLKETSVSEVVEKIRKRRR
ncbi:MAG: hypothetical protein JW969_12530 [Spirochaetales bacterium]|nr:hypothetical protein [Spirochaetales bacterium]